MELITFMRSASNTILVDDLHRGHIIRTKYNHTGKNPKISQTQTLENKYRTFEPNAFYTLEFDKKCFEQILKINRHNHCHTLYLCSSA